MAATFDVNRLTAGEPTPSRSVAPAAKGPKFASDEEFERSADRVFDRHDDLFRRLAEFDATR